MTEMKKIINVFTAKQKLQVVILFGMTIVGSFLELLGVSAIMPFVNVAMSPNSIEDNTQLSWLYHTLGMQSVSGFLVILAFFLVFVYVAKNAFLVLLYNYQYKFTYRSQQILEGKLLSCYMHQNYIFHLSQNSAELQRNILQDVTGFFQSVLAALQLLTEALVCLALFLYLLVTDPTITLGVAMLLSLFVLIFMGYFRKKIGSIGAESRYASAKRVQWVQQSLGGIKEIKILGREEYFLHSYDENAIIYAEKQRKYQLATIVPRPIMETLGISSLLIIVAIKLMNGADISYMLPVLSVFAIAAFRLLPSFGRITGYMGTISFNHAAVNEVCKDIVEAERLLQAYKEREEGSQTMQLKDSIYIRDISFCYPNTDQYVLHHADVTIPKNRSVAFIGPSGAGKTTLADIILGILEPQEGQILADGVDVYKNLDAWHQKLGYIPQSIYLMDDTIRNNIAFGIAPNEINEERIMSALKEAQLLELVQGLEEGLDTYIGERGVRLSGGQRQRIGIARALYTNPEVLILDEATSALDNETEKAIMEAIDMLQGNKTLLIIAHRLSTIQNCDYIYEIRDGKATLKERKDS
ncbi:MAG: ABC transporter ATP-binding protein [Lachnospiraceae bacterium]